MLTEVSLRENQTHKYATSGLKSGAELLNSNGARHHFESVNRETERRFRLYGALERTGLPC